ncbi:MAG: hypothetical protein IIV74_00750 [Alphaproteobacteria bacterium]|nr:hypothetical protein [Alphaproteobacteria bacterium]
MKKIILFISLLATVCIPAYADSPSCDMEIYMSSKSKNALVIKNFTTGDFNVPDACKTQINQLLDKKLTNDIIGIEILGFASNLGTPGYNSVLAYNRANAIGDLIKKHGKFNENIPLYERSAGESHNNVTNPGNPSDNTAWRTVEVVFTYPQATDKYRTIIFLRELKAKHNLENCDADKLFDEYIKYLRTVTNNTDDANTKITDDTNFDQGKIDAAIQKCTANNPAAQQEAASFTHITAIHSRLTKIHNSFRTERSVWRDADGNFNTARLVSDSIAGVVLGTTGGLITSNIVKKNQIKNGFEDIKCTIGGQRVATWGDEFRVGIQ